MIASTRPDDSPETISGSGTLVFLAGVLALLARIGGLVLLLVGLWFGVKVIGEAWGLYQHPESIQRFADAVESGSNIDKALLSGNRNDAGQNQQSAGFPASGDDFRPSYFLTWIIVPVMLLILGRLAAWAVYAGGRLALTGSVARLRPGRPESRQ